MKNKLEHINDLLEKQLFQLVPFNLSVIDKNYNIILGNKNFEDYFGDWKGKKCYEVYKKSKKPCTHCDVASVFDNGEIKVSNESGIDVNGKSCHYVVNLAPLKEDDGKINYVIEMSTDLTKTTLYQNQYNILFEKVPGYVAIIDKDYRIVRANTKFRNTFGDVRGKYCYEVYKKRKKQCRRCPAAQTFKDGKDHVSSEVGLTYTGVETQYIVNTTPLSTGEDDVSLVIEIATDITEINQLHEQLRHANDFLSTLINNSQDAIVAINEKGRTEIFNPAAKELFDWQSFKKPVENQIKKMMPEEFFSMPAEDGTIMDNPEISIKTLDETEVPARINAVELRSKKDILGRVAFLQDLRQLKDLEKQNLDAERLGAVGQTVAGLAHTIKNLLMGLEGGIYIVDTGLKKGDAKRILEGWEILLRNFNKTTDLVKGFLSFAKGRLPVLTETSPNEMIINIWNLYKDAAKAQHVELTVDLSPETELALLDEEGMEACITNLLSNAIDAATLREDKKGKVLMKAYDEGDNLIFEVRDNGTGIDSEIMKNIFTTFFTTKGAKGTGLGLLTTNKIVMEHGGNIDVQSEKGKGSVFKIILPRQRLKLLSYENESFNQPEE